MQTVLITGVAGFLGSHLADNFLKHGWRVKGVDNLLGGYKDNVPTGVQFIEADLTELSQALEEAFSQVDLVVHAACTAYEGLSVFSPSLVVDNTVMATVNSLMLSVNSKVKRFVYLSSMARYGDHGGKTFEEEFETHAQDPYGIAKVSSEHLVKNISDTHGMQWVILVPHNIIGPRQKYDDPFRNVASIMANRMLQGNQPIIYGDGTQRRCFSFVEDVVQPVMNACLRDDAISQIINVGPDEETVTINELAEYLAEIIGFDLDPIYVPERPKEVKFATCSSNKARRLLDYKTSVDLESGLRELVSWIESRGTRDFDYHLPIEIQSELTPTTWTKKQI